MQRMTVYKNIGDLVLYKNDMCDHMFILPLVLFYIEVYCLSLNENVHINIRLRGTQ